MAEKKKVIYVKVVPTLHDRLRRASEVLTEVGATPVDMSDIVREALTEKLQRLATKHPQIAAA
jgi:hypothetical protein